MNAMEFSNFCLLAALVKNSVVGSLSFPWGWCYLRIGIHVVAQGTLNIGDLNLRDRSGKGLILEQELIGADAHVTKFKLSMSIAAQLTSG